MADRQKLKREFFAAFYAMSKSITLLDYEVSTKPWQRYFLNGKRYPTSQRVIDPLQHLKLFDPEYETATKNHK